MSDANKARRTAMEVFFAGVDITSSMQKYLLSLTYTDNEEDETDDLQIKLQDRENIWLEEWLNTAIQSSVDSAVENTELRYRVTAKSGLTVRSSAKSDSKSKGTLAYGTIIEVKEISDGWANFQYSGESAYADAAYLQKVYIAVDDVTLNTSPTAVTFSGSPGKWNVGDSVIVTGRPQYSSYGTGAPGTMVTNYQGEITHLNLKDGIPYPIHVGYLGWFAESQVQFSGGTSVSASEDADEVGKGMKIQASIIRQNWTGNGEDEKLECGQFELDSVDASGPPSTITIKGTSLPYSSTIRQTKKSKSWENYTLSGVAEEIAENNGMACMFLCESNPSYERVEQYKTSDISFLQKLSQDAGYSLKITNNVIVIFDQEAYESQEPIRTIRRGKNGGYTKHKLTTKKNDIFTSCRVSYVDSDGNTISATAYVNGYDKDNEKNQCLEIRQKVASKEEAEMLAKKMLRLHNKYEFMAMFSFPGDITLLAGCVVILEGWGAWDGKYIIKQAKHVVSDGYTTDITLRRVLKTSKGNADTEGMGGKSVDELAREVIRGDWGNGAERKRRLTEAGYDYDAVQKRVNEMLRK